MLLQFMLSSSYWPILSSFSMATFFIFFLYMVKFTKMMFFYIICLCVVSMSIWFRDLMRESTFMGSQNLFMQKCIMAGVVFFILSELFFFVSFFWCYSHFMLLQTGEMGSQWPPISVESINYMSVPLLNTLLLLTSGVSLTVSHNYLLMNSKKYSKFLKMTLVLGGMFTLCQFWEYKMLNFTWMESCYSSIFFMGTGFHGTHVLIGFMILMFLSIKKLNELSMMFDLGSWYWHFVDVIWIVLFTEFYWLSY